MIAPPSPAPYGDALATAEEARENRVAVREAIHKNAAFTPQFVLMNALATIVACYGLLADSTAVVIGAMIIAVLLGPISGIALALVDGDGKLLKKAMGAEIGGALVVLLVAFIIGSLHHDVPITHELLARTRPNVLDLMIALAGGAAGAYATVSPRLSVGLVGVAISTALVPPLATCGMCLARHENNLAWGGFLLFFTNLVAIQFASSVVMWLSGFHAVTDTAADVQKTRMRLLATNGVSVASLTFLTVIMGSNFVRSLQQQRFENDVRDRLEAGLRPYPGVHLADVKFRHGNDSESVIAVVRTPFSFSPERVAKLEDTLPHPRGKQLELELMSVLVKETTRKGYLHELPAPTPVPPGEDEKPVVKLPETSPQIDTTDTQVFGQ